MSSVATSMGGPLTHNTHGTGPEGVSDELWPFGRRTRVPGAFAPRVILKRGDDRHPRRG